MIIKEVKSFEYILNQDEIKVIKNCLYYCRHRIKEHNKNNIGNINKIDEILKQITSIQGDKTDCRSMRAN